MAKQMAHFRYDPVKCQKMVKLSEGPDPRLCDMNGGIVVVCRTTNQMTVTNPFDRTDSLCFKKIVNSLSLMVKAWMERAEKSAN
jgi:hypothetical protein